MLLERENPAAGIEWSDQPEPGRRQARVLEPFPSADREAPSRYGHGRRPSPTAMAVTAAVHALLALALLGLGAQAGTSERERLTVVELSVAPPPPPASAPETPVEQQPQTLQPPAIQLPMPLAPIVPVSPVPIEPAPVTPAQAPAVAQPVAAPPAPPAAPAAPGVVEASDLATRLVAGDPPRYPIESRRRKEQGIVHLALVVGTDGRVEAISIDRSSGHARLDNAALKAVRSWRWAPTVRNGVAAKVRGIVEIPFVLQPAG